MQGWTRRLIGSASPPTLAAPSPTLPRSTKNRRVRPRQDADHAGAACRRHPDGRDQGGDVFPDARLLLARHDHRHQHDPRAQGRQLCAADHPGLSRHLRDRPDQPAGIYNLFFQKHEPLIERALRFEIRERMDAARPCAHRSSTKSRCAQPQSLRSAPAPRRSPSCSCIPIAIPRTRSARRRSIAGDTPSLFVSASHELSQEYREFERTSTVAANAYVGPRVSAISRSSNTHLRDADLAALFLIVQSTGGLVRRRRSEAAPASACWNRAGCRRHRHQGALRRYRLKQRHRLRHGRHHRQGRRHP